jgi:hypothetical protein
MKTARQRENSLAKCPVAASRRSAKSIRFFVAIHQNALLPKVAPHFAPIGLSGYRPTTSLVVLGDDTGDSKTWRDASFPVAILDNAAF